MASMFTCLSGRGRGPLKRVGGRETGCCGSREKGPTWEGVYQHIAFIIKESSSLGKHFHDLLHLDHHYNSCPHQSLTHSSPLPIFVLGLDTSLLVLQSAITLLATPARAFSLDDVATPPCLLVKTLHHLRPNPVATACANARTIAASTETQSSQAFTATASLLPFYRQIPSAANRPQRDGTFI